MKYPKDITGMRFGRLTAVKKVGTKGSGRGSKAIWLCRCDCGNEKEILRNSLVSGTTKSCGCLEKEIKSTMHLKHGMEKLRLWNIWTGMRDRCSRSNNKDYQRYGGRGIRVCPEWDSDFRNFYDWSMGNGYSDELTIDRIDNDGNYEPSNCRWVTRKEQTRNRSITKTIPLARIAEIDGITYQAAYDKYVRCNVSNLSGAKSQKECDGMCTMK